MAGKKQFPNGTWQYTFKRKGVLDKPVYLTFDSEEEGDRYAARVDALLARKILPPELQTEAPATKVTTLRELVALYEDDAHPSEKDRAALRTIVAARGATRLTDMDTDWVDGWISEMKRVDKVAPATIRAKVGALARCCDWGMRKKLLSMPDHPLRTLPEGYSQYTKADEAAAGVKREDVERDRRLEGDELERSLAVIEGGVLARKVRPMTLPYPLALRCLLVVAVESAMRLRELYTLTIAQIDLVARTVFLDKTKNGDKRQVPLSSVALAELKGYILIVHGAHPRPDALVFPFWDGDQASLPDVSDYLSKLFIDIFEQAGAEDLKFHDLRHEATSRLFEKTVLSETEIMKITGHKSHRMMMRYANLRGSTLADRLW
ncbi:site-specific integrase [Paracidovorax avenae]|uniref:site-specific integrase n=1 Tax=Paracidovorax avenae TaxID=80867 RepID=UPI000D21C870|nr:site-specific integrase [Paracidovorax avenae]AVS68175.1 site-specific integrase [Paracidovorax avenae]